jgi:hypothetical protein
VRALALCVLGLVGEDANRGRNRNEKMYLSLFFKLLDDGNGVFIYSPERQDRADV